MKIITKDKIDQVLDFMSYLGAKQYTEVMVKTAQRQPALAKYINQNSSYLSSDANNDGLYRMFVFTLMCYDDYGYDIPKITEQQILKKTNEWQKIFNGNHLYLKIPVKIDFMRGMSKQLNLGLYYDTQIKGTKTTKPFFDEEDFSLAYLSMFVCNALLNDEIIKLQKEKK